MRHFTFNSEDLGEALSDFMIYDIESQLNLLNFTDSFNFTDLSDEEFGEAQDIIYDYCVKFFKTNFSGRFRSYSDDIAEIIIERLLY